MKLFTKKSIIVLLALTMVLMMTSMAAAADPIKSGFYVHDADKSAGQKYSYYSLPYILAPDNFSAFLDYRDNFRNAEDFIWVDGQEKFVSLANWDSGPALITDVVANLGSATYYNVENNATMSLALGARPAVSDPSKTGFSLSLSREIAGLTGTDLAIPDVKDIVVSESDDDKNFTVRCSLTPGQAYTLTITKPGFDFGEALNIEVPTETITLAATPVTDPSKTGFTLNLNPALTGLVKGDFRLEDQFGQPITINTVATTDGGASYQFAAGLSGEESYILTCPGDRYELSAPVSFTVPPEAITTTIESVTVNDLVVKLAPGVNDIPGASFKLLDSSDQRVLSMILAKTGDPTTEYKLAAFPYLNAGSDYSIEVIMGGYDFGGAKSFSPAQTSVTMNVAETASTGFSVTMNPAVPGLTANNFSLKNAQNNNVPFAVSTKDNGTTYDFRADIIAGSTYKVSAIKNGISFGDAQDVSLPVAMIGAGGTNGTIYVYLNGVLDSVPAVGEFTITRKIGEGAVENTTPTNISQNTTTRMLSLAVEPISSVATEQTVTGSVTYLEVTEDYTFTVPPLIPAPTASAFSIGGAAGVTPVNGTIVGNEITFVVEPGTTYTTASVALSRDAYVTVTKAGESEPARTEVLVEQGVLSADAGLLGAFGITKTTATGAELIAQTPSDIAITVELKSVADATKKTTYTIRFVAAAPTASAFTIGGAAGVTSVNGIVVGNEITFVVQPGAAYTTAGVALSQDAYVTVTKAGESTPARTDILVDQGVLSTDAGLLGAFDTTKTSATGAELIAQTPTGTAITVLLKSKADPTKTTTYTVKFVAGAPTAYAFLLGGDAGVTPVNGNIVGNQITFVVDPAAEYTTASVTLSHDVRVTVTKAGETAPARTGVLVDQGVLSADAGLLGAFDITKTSATGAELIAQTPSGTAITVELESVADPSNKTTYTVKFVTVIPTAFAFSIGGAAGMPVNGTVAGNEITFAVDPAATYTNASVTLSQDVRVTVTKAGEATPSRTDVLVNQGVLSTDVGLLGAFNITKNEATGTELIAQTPTGTAITVLLKSVTDATKTTTYTVKFVTT